MYIAIYSGCFKKSPSALTLNSKKLSLKLKPSLLLRLYRVQKWISSIQPATSPLFFQPF